MFVRCRSTVRTLRHKRSAIASFVRPSDTRSSTSRSRPLRWATAIGGNGLRVRAKERLDFQAEHSPRRLLLEQDVIRGLEQDEVSVWNQCGEQPALFDRDYSIVSRVHDQGARVPA